MFCRISLFSFSMAPFWHEEFGSAICIYIRIKCLASPLMMDEFRPIIGCCGFDVYLVRHKPPDYRFCQSLGILPLVEFSHEQHVGRSMIVTIAQCPSLPMMVSISKSPNRLPSISMGC